MPKNCKWNGAPERSAFGCSGSCSKTQFLLNTDDYVDDKGVGECYYGRRNLCCDSTEVFDSCYWTTCRGPLLPLDPAECDRPDDEYMTSRFDDTNGDFCSASFNSPLTDRFKRGFCCPKGKGHKKCNWSNDPLPVNGLKLFPGQEQICRPQSCAKGQTEVTEALRCAGNTFSANMKMYLDTDIEMEATSTTSSANRVFRTYAYFSLEPSAYLGLRITGNARLQATTGRKKLLDTISYPGLAIKGIAAVGPTLDLYGEVSLTHNRLHVGKYSPMLHIRGVVTLKGEMRAGAKVNFGKAEVYWPQDDAASDKYQTLLGLDTQTSAPDKDLIAPTFDAKVRVDATLDINVTPEV
ncbi:MAG: hypothetical protein Q9221_002411 [Calogaya cf. arnoldii]